MAKAKKRSTAKSAKEIQKKFSKPVRSPKKEIKSVNNQLRQVRQPIYRLNKKIASASSKYYKSKYRKELNTYKEKNSSAINNLVSIRSDLKTLDKEFASLKAEKRRLQRELNKIESKIKTAKRKKDKKAVGDLSLDHVNRVMKIRDIEQAVGQRKMIKAPIGEPQFDSRQPAGFQSDPNNPYTFWQGVRQFDEDVKSGHWSFIIVGGRRYSGKNPIETSSAGKEYFSTISADSNTQIFRYINYNSSTVKFVVNYDTSSDEES